MSSAGLARTLKSLCITGDLSKAVRLLCQSPLCPGARTYALLLQECVNRRDARLGRRIHARMVATGFRCGEYITTKLLIFYAKIGDLGCAQKLFDGMPHRSVVAWNAMISGCARGGAGEQERAVELFGAMRAEGLAPDQFTFASALCACARLAALERGRRVHAVAAKSDVGGNVFANSALVDMYLKCSSPEDARRAFAAAPEAERHHVDRGHLRARPAGARRRGAGALRPDGGGRVPAQRRDVPRRALGVRARRARRRGAEAVRVHVVGLRPHAEGAALRGGGRHARQGRQNTGGLRARQEPAGLPGALGGLGRAAGRLQEARRRHGAGGARRAAVLHLQPGNAGKYVVLANTYAAREMWDSVSGAHEAMRALGVKKDRAWSAVEVEGEKHTFIAGDSYYDEYLAIYEVCTALASAVSEQSARATDGARHC